MEKPWGGVDPNSAHQRWSRWVFVVTLEGQSARVQLNPVRDAWQRYIPRLFKTTVGRGMATMHAGDVNRCVLTAEIEGPAVHDSMYRDYVRREFVNVFMLGFGPGARFDGMDASLLAGSAEDGSPAKQLVVLPSLTPVT